MYCFLPFAIQDRSPHTVGCFEKKPSLVRVARTVQHTSEPSPAKFRHLFVVKEDSGSVEKQKTKGIFYTGELLRL